jgi:hypothetical protein
MIDVIDYNYIKPFQFFYAIGLEADYVVGCEPTNKKYKCT